MNIRLTHTVVVEAIFKISLNHEHPQDKAIHKQASLCMSTGVCKSCNEQRGCQSGPKVLLFDTVLPFHNPPPSCLERKRERQLPRMNIDR